MSSTLRSIFLPLLLTLTATAAAGTKDLVNDSIRACRALQNEDGSYGPADRQPLITARLLQALGDCDEHYTSQDGPFVRDAVAALLTHQRDDGAFADQGDPRRVGLTAEVYLALSATARTAAYDEARAKAREFLSSSLEKGDLDSATSAQVQRALTGKSAPAIHLARYLEPGETLTRDADWLKTVAPRLLQAQEKELASLDPAGIPLLVDRLLALIDRCGVESSLRSESDELAPMPRRATPASDEEARERIEAAIAFLDSSQQDGTFGMGGHADPGITGLALSALIRICDRTGLERPAYIGQGLDWLVSLQKEDGSIFQMGLKNYVTSVSVEALAASGDPRYEAAIQRATTFLTETQLDEGEGYSAEADPYYGGFGYGSSEKPDLSNTQMALQALHEAGVPEGDPAYQKAIQFLNRCQNRAETGTAPIVRRDGVVVTAGNDGGAVYRPGDSKAGTDVAADGKVFARSYGSMTYALLKSYLFAGLDPDDDRVREAVRWISQHYTLEVNPGFESGSKSEPYQGLYYYYLTLARALKAIGTDEIVDEGGTARNWRSDLREMLFSLQAEEGFWINQRSSRWMEGNSVLTTAYALLALAETS
ncbi:MAG: prenyltransferase/squalene oxidase repeat-containing protein [Planctomycetota bacterium]